MFISYAQNFEDVMLNRIFKDKNCGFYIDVGAHHPIYDSVTKAFYDRGWRGINIEPVKEFFTLLQDQRPEDINLNLAVSDISGKLSFFELLGSGFSTLDGEMAQKLARENDLTLLEYEVPAQTLAEICDKNVTGTIDFLKIDVEGWEEQIILGNDWQRFRPNIIIVEATIPNSMIKKSTNIDDILKQNNYQRVYFDGLNDFYLAEEVKELSCFFQTPPNVFDQFISFKVVELNQHTDNLNQILQEREQEMKKLSQHTDNLNQILQEREQEMKELSQHTDNLNQILQQREQEMKELSQHTDNLNQILQQREQEIANFQEIIEQDARKIGILSNYLDDERYETQRLTQALTQIHNTKNEEISHYQSKITELESQLCQVNHQFAQLQERITAMESSKFWNMRKVWFRLRKTFNIKGD